jgi:5-methylcytosine-specific restriction endonuclease McrA
MKVPACASKGRPPCPLKTAARVAGAPRYVDKQGVERFTASGNSVAAKRKWCEQDRRAKGVKPPKPKAPPDVIAKKNREHVRRWRKENPQGKASQQRTYRARRFGTHGRHDRHAVALLFSKQDGQCFYCAGPMEPVTWDHFIPSSRGGENNIDNGRLACHSCNTRKNDTPPRDFFVQIWNAI